MVYGTKPGSKLSKREAQEVGEYLEKMGSFTPEDVVQDAKNSKSPLHNYFTWNDTKAGEKYRLIEARMLINHITVKVTKGDQEIETRAFQSIAFSEGGDEEDGDERVERRYTAIRIVSQDVNMRDQVIERAKRELESWSLRYQQYQDVFGQDLFKQIKKAVKKIRTGQSTGEMANV